jgi:hypothetical protein
LLRRHGYIANAIWSIWEADIARLLGTLAFRQEWSQVRQRFENHPHFSDWVIERQTADPRVIH